jgi:hypothetical protein
MSYGSLGTSAQNEMLRQSQASMPYETLKKNCQFIDEYPNLAKRKVSRSDKFSLVFGASLFTALLLIAMFFSVQRYLSRNNTSVSIEKIH